MKNLFSNVNYTYILWIKSAPKSNQSHNCSKEYRLRNRVEKDRRIY